MGIWWRSQNRAMDMTLRMTTESKSFGLVGLSHSLRPADIHIIWLDWLLPTPPFSKTKQGNPKTKNQQQLAILETDLKKGQCCTNFEETTNSGCVAGFERVVSPPNTSRVASWLCHSNWCPRPRSPRCRSGTVGEAMAARLAPDTSTKIIKFPA